jgi:hypothetical protein
VPILYRIAGLTFLAFSLLQPSTGFIPQSGSQPGSTQSAGSAKKSPARPAPTAQEIADAKSKGLVWVNLSTRVYHQEGPSYGTTKRGKFMTEEEAKKAGYRAAKENEPSKKAAAPGHTK